MSNAALDETPITLTAAQRAIISADGQTNLLVDAGAGSGKTTTVVQLLLHALGCDVGSGADRIAGASEPLSLDQLAAITFTNAAAADLKRKLRKALRSAGRADLATDVDAARIGTIHSFCGDLLRTYALRAQLPPAQRVLTEAEAHAVSQDAARDVLHEALAAATPPQLGALVQGRKLGDVVAWLARAASDQDRLERWSDRSLAVLRDHELALQVLAWKAVARRHELLDTLGARDFHGMIVDTRELLRDDAIRHALQRRLKLLVIDEFQDVDPAQQEIAMLLAGLERPDPTRTRIVLVGDPKQSIYRFRRADVTLWERSAERFRAGAGQVLPLNDNFRSKAAILGFVDHAMGALLDRPLAEDSVRQPYEVDFTPLVPRASHAEGDEAVELFVLAPDAKGKPLTANPVRDAEVPTIVERLSALHDGGRGTAWAEMAILIPTWNAATALQRALTVAGIPSYVPRGNGFWEAREVLDCVLALRAVRDTSDDIAVMGFFKSPFVGLRDETLLRMAQGLPVTSPTERALLDQARERLARYGALRDRLPSDELLERLLSETGYLAALALDPDGAQRVANVRKLLRELHQARDQSLGEFLRGVRDARARADDVAPERLYGERGNVVTITTVHSAKGLEWDVVVLADLASQLKEPSDAYLEGRETFAIRDVPDDDDPKAKDERHEELKGSEGREQLAERLRQWYVAATRAKHRLLLFTLPLGESKRPTSAAAHLLSVLGELTPDQPYEYASRAGTQYRAVVRRANGQAPEVARAEHSEPALPLPPAPLRAPIGAYRLSASQLMAFAKDPVRWRHTYVDRVPTLDDAAEGRASGATVQRAIVTGQIVHEVLERLVNDDVDLDALLEESIGRWDADAPEAETAIGAAVRAQLRKRVSDVVSSPVWREVAALPGATRELEFTHLLGDGTAIVGAMDLAALRDGGAEIVDVKSSGAAGPELATRYEVQAAVYTEAMRAITGAADVRFRLVSTAHGEGTEVVPVSSVGALVAALRGALDFEINTPGEDR